MLRGNPQRFVLYKFVSIKMLHKHYVFSLCQIGLYQCVLDANYKRGSTPCQSLLCSRVGILSVRKDSKACLLAMLWNSATFIVNFHAITRCWKT